MSVFGNIDVVDPREDKLPRWAQAKLDDARRQVQEARARADLAIQETDPDEALAIIERYSFQVGLKDDRITFRPRKGADYLECIDVDPIRGGIRVHARTGPIWVTPVSSNVVHIKAGVEW